MLVFMLSTSAAATTIDGPLVSSKCISNTTVNRMFCVACLLLQRLLSGEHFWRFGGSDHSETKWPILCALSLS